LAARLTASADIFNKRGRKPWASVNFVTAHDGFTLNDLVSFNEKHNKANGENNKDGHDHNLSWNYGVEGPTHDEKIRDLRLRQMRNMLATLLFSQGTPMLLAGDEFGRTQKGNNNAYAQDNEVSWINWEAIDSDGEKLLNFTRKLIHLRHSQPILRRGRFLAGTYNGDLDVKDVTWLTPAGKEMSPEDWEDGHARCISILLDGRAQPTGIRKRGTDVTLLLILNAHNDVVRCKLPEVAGGRAWLCHVNTSRPDLDISLQFNFGSDYEAAGHSLQLFQLMPKGSEQPGAVRLR
jgi:isoamylase